MLPGFHLILWQGNTPVFAVQIYKLLSKQKSCVTSSRVQDVRLRYRT